MDGYRPGSVKAHPDYPATSTVAVRTVFEDDDNTGCLSWLVVAASGGSFYRTEASVADWPDVEGMTQLLATAAP